MMTKAQQLEVGRRVLEGFERGRRKAIEQAKQRSRRHTAIIVPLVNADIEAGRSARGRPGRIARRLGGALSEAQVRRIMYRLLSVQNSLNHNEENPLEVVHALR